jgi:peptidoglycan/LPS O-acetylase OafA/YrhL
MTDVVNPPPMPKLLDYPVATTLTGVLFGVTIALLVSRYFDPTGGALTISLLVVFAFIGTVVFCLFFTVPTDEITSSVLGGLVASFGAVIAFWLGKSKS